MGAPHQIAARRGYPAGGTESCLQKPACRMADTGVVALFLHGLEDGVLVGVAEGLQCDPQLHAALAIDIDKLVVLQFDDVSIFPGYNGGDPQQFAGAVGKMYGEGKYASAVNQPVLHQRGDGDDVHVASGEDRHHVFVLAVQVAQSGYGEQAGIFHHHLVLLHHIQEGVHQLVVVDGEDLVDVLLDRERSDRRGF